MDRIVAMLTAIGFPYAYDHFAEGESPNPPFICYLLPRSQNFSADGLAFFKLSEVNFELYTDRKDPTRELAVETVLDANSIYYNKTEVWIESEKLYEVSYSFYLEV